MIQAKYPSFGILLVDDEEAWLSSLSLLLESSAGLTNLHTISDSRQVLQRLADGDIGLMLLDVTMPHIGGRELLQMVSELHPEVAVVMVSGVNQIETAVECIRLGAQNYFVKTDGNDRIISGVMQAVRMQELTRENREIQTRLTGGGITRPEAFDTVITRDPAMLSLFSYIEAVAASPHPILLTGESGVGKELLAQAAHALSGRKGELVAVNVAGLDDTVFSDTLFGHVKGAFTGADTPRKGMIEAAAGGTLFLDEIGDLSLASQVKLLRLLQEGEYYPLGSDRPRRMQTRIIVATHQDLGKLEHEGRFRKDLYYRLKTHKVHIPPLRERKGDIPLLLEHFLHEAAETLGKKCPTAPVELCKLLMAYHFPGNIRELRGMVFDAVSQHKDRVLSMESFRRALDDTPEDTGRQGCAIDLTHWEQLPPLSLMADMLVEEAMRRAQGNQSVASRILGISQPALSKRLKQMRGEEE